MTTKYALLAVDPAQYRYYVPCGMSAILWRWAGYRPFIMQFGPADGWNKPLASRALEEIKKTDPIIKEIELFDVPAWSQNRIFHCITGGRRIAASMWFDPFSYVILGDGDMLLLNDDYLIPEPTMSFHCWGVDMFHKEDRRFPRWPSCYQGATAGVWKEIMRPSSDDLAKATYDHIEQTKPYVDEHFKEVWNCEPGFHAMLSKWHGYRKYCYMAKRQHLEYSGRLYVRTHMVPKDPVDCHIRNDWRQDMHWEILMNHSPRVPDHIKKQLCSYRDDCLQILRDTRDTV